MDDPHRSSQRRTKCVRTIPVLESRLVSSARRTFTAVLQSRPESQRMVGHGEDLVRRRQYLERSQAAAREDSGAYQEQACHARRWSHGLRFKHRKRWLASAYRVDEQFGIQLESFGVVERWQDNPGDPAHAV